MLIVCKQGTRRSHFFHTSRLRSFFEISVWPSRAPSDDRTVRQATNSVCALRSTSTTANANPPGP